MNVSKPSSPDRRDRILEGAGGAFLRFGFERASMADIAAGAGVSRTALYHYFPNKEDVLRAVINQLHGDTLSAAAIALAAAATLDDALIGLLDARIGGILRLLATSPHAYELIEAGSRLTGLAISDADEHFLKMVIKALEGHGRVDNAEQIADTLVAAAKGLMRSSDGLVPYDRFQDRLERLVCWVTS